MQDYPSRFYECYLEIAAKFDKDFVKSCNEDLNLIIVPVSSAIRVCVYVLILAVGQFGHPHDFHGHCQYQLRRLEGRLPRLDSHCRAARLRGPTPLDSGMLDPITMTTLASLSLSLAFSLISVFSAMVVKQWLKRCDLVDAKGPPPIAAGIDNASLTTSDRHA